SVNFPKALLVVFSMARYGNHCILSIPVNRPSLVNLKYCIFRHFYDAFSENVNRLIFGHIRRSGYFISPPLKRLQLLLSLDFVNINMTRGKGPRCNHRNNLKNNIFHHSSSTSVDIQSSALSHSPLTTRREWAPEPVFVPLTISRLMCRLT